MKLEIFSVYDQKANAFLPPWTLPTQEMAERTFADCINDREHAFGKHPQDYTLFHLGTFDDESAEITGWKKSMGNGVEYLPAENLGRVFPVPTEEQANGKD